MSDAREILDRLAAERQRHEQETRHWEEYRRLCGPPRWFLLLLAFLGFASVVLVAEVLLSIEDGAALLRLSRAGLVLYAMLWPVLLIYVESRRRRGLRKILQREAPELAAKLADERILR